MGAERARCRMWNQQKKHTLRERREGESHVRRKSRLAGGAQEEEGCQGEEGVVLMVNHASRAANDQAIARGPVQHQIGHNHPPCHESRVLAKPKLNQHG